MSTAAIIVAAGRGIRAGGEIPKQYQYLAGLPILARSIRAFDAHPSIDQIVVVIHPDDVAFYDSRVAPHRASVRISRCFGGADRRQSVLNGLNSLAANPPDAVLIHDGARPLVSAAQISAVCAALAQNPGAAPAVGLSDTLWRGENGHVTGQADRAGMYRAQTPQGFDFSAIYGAHKSFSGGLENATDDVGVALASGLSVKIIAGDPDNIKITQAADFQRAARIIGGSMDIRTGNGFDVHAFQDGDHVVLCGVKIPHTHSLKGHSDADVAMHAVSDAIYGALGEGDIGQWFPPDNPDWRGAASDIFLRHAVGRAQERGFTITHSDCTIICEHPKIGPHAPSMRACLAGVMEIDVGRISVKATTSEKLGFTGRGEGIAALATVTLVKS